MVAADAGFENGSTRHDIGCVMAAYLIPFTEGFTRSREGMN